MNPNNERKEFIAYYNSQDTIRGYFATTNDKLTIMDNNDVEITGEKKDWIGKNSTIMPMYYGGQKKLWRVEYFSRRNCRKKIFSL